MGPSDENAITGINVTPLVDITLVLLIIFMVTAKLVVSRSIPLELPKAKSPRADPQAALSVVLAQDGNTFVDARALPSDEGIFAVARDAHDRDGERRVVIKADSAVSHGRVVHVLDLIQQAGLTKVSFAVTNLAPGVAP